MIFWIVGRLIYLEVRFQINVLLLSPFQSKSKRLTAKWTSKLIKLKKEGIVAYLKLLIE